MAEYILHQYDSSPYAYKARLCFGFKRLAWRAVIIPIVMPKPLLMPLTGGYRKTPVLQIGADLYFDTSLIAAELERRHPAPSLYPVGGEGLAQIFAAWSDQSLFLPAANFALSIVADKLPPAFFEDRAKMMNRPVTPIEKMKAAIPLFKSQMCLQLDRLASLLSDGRSFLLGEQPGLADIAAAHPIWMAAKNSGKRAAAAFDAYPTVRAWVDRVDAIGQGARSEMSGEEALAIAKAAEPAPPRESEEVEGAPKPGMRVSVQTEDRAPEPVVGEVVMVRRNEIAIRRSAPEVGDVVVHVPRAGFIIRPA